MLKNKQLLLIYLLLPVAALIAFWQLNRCDFINYDDPHYVTENVHIRHGITLEAIRWAFTAGYAANWHPITWMSHMLDIQLFGLNPRCHHMINLLFHIANTLLLFFVFHRMTKAPWKSAFVAALFAIHPLHVESVAWVAERKDVLSTFFWMLTMVAYIYYVELPSRFRYSAVVTFFALGLMAKPMLVTLPFVLLLLDYWPLRRLQGAGSGEHGAGSAKENAGLKQQPVSANKRKSRKKLTDQSIAPHSVLVTPEVFNPRPRHPGSVHSGASVLSSPPSALRPLLLEKIPLFALATLSCIVTFITQQKGGAVTSADVFPFGVRIANAFVSYVIYISKTIWPHDLTVFYPHPGLRPSWQVLGAALLLIAVTVTVILRSKSFPFMAFGWLWFTGTLVPVIGIVQVGTKSMADRYTYVPLIGLFVMAVWGIPELLQKWQPAHPRCKGALFASSALVLLPLLIVTWTQVGYWHDSILLYDHGLKVTSHNDVIHYNRGVAYTKLGAHRQAIEDFNKAIEINPGRVEPYYNRGLAYAELGDYRQAIENYNTAVEIDPENSDAYLNRGVAYGKIGNHGQAIADYDTAIEIDPKQARAFNDRGIAHGKLGNHRQAIEDFDRAVGIDPGYAKAYYNRGAAYANLGKDMWAIEDLKRAAKLDCEEARDFLRSRGINWSE